MQSYPEGKLSSLLGKLQEGDTVECSGAALGTAKGSRWDRTILIRIETLRLNLVSHPGTPATLDAAHKNVVMLAAGTGAPWRHRSFLSIPSTLAYCPAHPFIIVATRADANGAAAAAGS